MSEKWNDRDHEDATKIVDAVARADGNIVGALQVARGAGFSIAPNRIEASRRRVYKVMPLAVERSVFMYPGKVLHVYPDQTYKLGNDVDNEMLNQIVGRQNKGLTALQRAATELSVGTTPAQQNWHDALAAIVTLANHQLETLASTALQESGGYE